MVRTRNPKGGNTVKALLPFSTVANAVKWSVMFSKDTSHNIFIDIGAERLIDLLRDPWATEVWIASFQFDDGLDEFGGRSLWSWFSFAVSRI